MTLLMSYLALGGGVFVFVGLLKLAIRLARVNKVEAKKSALRAHSTRDAILGRARMHEDWLPDARIKGGMIYNKSKKRLEISGRLSEESFDRVFK